MYYNTRMRDKIINHVLKNQFLTATIVLATLWLVVVMREVLIALFISYILMAAITPYVKFLRERRVPRIIAVVIPYIATILALALIIVLLLPFFVSQISLLFSLLPEYLNHDISFFGTTIHSDQLGTLATNELGNIGSNAISLTTRVFGGVISAISVFAISFYLLLYKESVKDGFVSIFPKHYQNKVSKTSGLIEDKLGSWLRGQIVLSGCIGILTWIILTILGVEFALPLAVIAGVLEIVPTIGPIVSAIPAVIVALSISPALAIIVAVAYLFIQLFENNVLVPRVMQRAVGLNPIVIIIGIIVGGKLLGIAGALLAIPFISLLVVAYKNLK